MSTQTPDPKGRRPHQHRQAGLEDAHEQVRPARRQAHNVLRLLSALSRALSGALDEPEILRDVAHLVVPGFADWCVASLYQGGAVVRSEFACANREHTAVLERVRDAQVPPVPNGPVATALETRTPVLHAKMNDAQLMALARDVALRDQLRALQVRSLIVVPLLAREHVLGGLAFVSLSPARPYDRDDVLLAEELAARAASAIDSARFHNEAIEAAQLREEFLSVAAHELKTPITNLRGLGQVLMRRLARGTATDPDRVHEVLTALDQQTGKLTRLIEQLLDVSRMRYGSLELDRTVSDLTNIVEGAASNARALGTGHTIRVSSPGPLMIQADPLRLEQVLTNLLDNAIKYGPHAGSIAIDIARVDATHVQIAVTDEGSGIPVEQHERIFDRFYQARSGVRKASGMGLGLYISRQIAEKHGGTVDIEDAQQGGTRFVVTLPLEQQDLRK